MTGRVDGARRRAALVFRRTRSEVRARSGEVVHSLRRRRQPQDWTRTSPHRVLTVATEDVALLTAHRLPEDVRGRRIDGDWDVRAVDVDSTRLAVALRRRFVDGRDWASCGLAEAGAEPEVPGLGDRYRTMGPAELARRMAVLDALHASLREEGWRPHHEVGAPFVREMAVCLGRDGQLIRNRGGLHRLIIARMIGLDVIPVRLLAEHVAAPVRPLEVPPTGH